MAIPSQFNEEFLLWFRARTEATWKRLPSYRLKTIMLNEDEVWYQGREGAKWLDPLPDEEIDAIEEQWRIRFPPDYRLFYKMLHATDKPHSEFSVGLFHNWQKLPSSIEHAYEHIMGGFVFDAIHNSHFWRTEWGPKPEQEDEARQRLQPIVDAAPRLIPLHLHRYLLAEPCQSGNPVLSIWQSDIIIYAPDLRTYLLHQFGRTFGRFGPSLLRLTSHDHKVATEEIKHLLRERMQEYKKIPFWGDYL